MEDGKDVNRVVNFSDAIFSIAITLLILNIKIPVLAKGFSESDLTSLIVKQFPAIQGFAISFFVIAFYWSAHHRIFRYIKRADSKLLWLNLFLLFFICFIPFPTSLLSLYGDHQIPVVIYAVTLACGGLFQFAIWYYATSHHRLVDKDLDEHMAHEFALRQVIAVAVFIFSIFVSFFSPALAVYSWFLIFFSRIGLKHLHRIHHS